MVVNKVSRMRQRFQDQRDMNADVKNNILCIALEAEQLELERVRMQLEDQQAKLLKLLTNLQKR